MDKETFVTLGTAVADEVIYRDKMHNAVLDTARANNRSTDFIGVSYDSELLLDTILELLGEDYLFWLFDCEQDWDKFCSRTEINGKHPDIHSLEELYELYKQEAKHEED